MTWLNLDTVEVKGNDFEVLPTGTYLMQVQEATVQTTKAGTGEYIKAKLQVVGTEGKGRVIFQNWNIKNPNAKAVEIGLESLKNFMMSAGCKTFKLESPKNLEGLACNAKVVVEESETYGKQNRITYFTPYTANGATKTTTKEATPETFGF